MARRTNMYVEKEITILELDSSVNKILKDNNIITVGNLWELNRKKLKDMGLKDTDIKQITIKLQLLGLDLNKRIYS